MKLYEPGRKRVLVFVAALCLSLLLFLISFHLFVYSPRFYDRQYAINGVYEHFGYDETWLATKELWKYMQFRGEFTSGFFSEQDQLHMVDVRNIFVRLSWVLYTVTMTLFVILLYQYTFVKKDFVFFVFDLLYSSGSLSFIFLIFLVILGVFFDYSFALFHRLFFFNDYWFMDPAVDKLVLLFPQQFFQNIFFSIITVVFLFSIILFCCSIYIQRKYLI